jgi:hypothetical protein
MLTGLYCPVCGGTRSLEALVRGDVLSSLRFHLIVPWGVLLGLAWYSERVLLLFGKSVQLVPRTKWFWYGWSAFFGVYVVVRNFIPALTP